MTGTFTLAVDQFIAGGDVRAVAVESEILPVEGKVLRVAEAIADAITTLVGFDTFVVLAHQSVRTHAARNAQIGVFRAGVRVLCVGAGHLAGAFVAFFVDGAVGTVDQTVVFGAPSGQVDGRILIAALGGHGGHRFASAFRQVIGRGLLLTFGHCGRTQRFVAFSRLLEAHAVAHDLHAAADGTAGRRGTFVKRRSFEERTFLPGQFLHLDRAVGDLANVRAGAPRVTEFLGGSRQLAAGRPLVIVNVAIVETAEAVHSRHQFARHLIDRNRTKVQHFADNRKWHRLLPPWPRSC